MARNETKNILIKLHSYITAVSIYSGVWREGRRRSSVVCRNACYDLVAESHGAEDKQTPQTGSPDKG